MTRRLVLLTLLALCAVPATANAAVRAPALDTPKAGALVEGVPALTWKAVRGADRYEYQLAADDAFSSIVLGSGRGRGAATTRNTAASIATTLPDGEYFWRVRAIDKRDRAGAWSRDRSFRKDWTTRALLLAPANDSQISWPSAPLVLRWTQVAHATRYAVVIATDPALASPVLGTANKPVVTQGTSYALQVALASGQRYYWAVTPLDADDHPGRRSEIGSFRWSWPTATATRFADLDASPGVLDPQFSWDPVPGAASYEVEVNFTENFSPDGRVCCGDPTIASALSPTRVLPNNDGANGFGYYWRVRPFDAAGNAGQWNHDPATDFTKRFDDVTPSIPNLRVSDGAGTTVTSGGIADTPVVQWDPVPGASSYDVQIAPHLGGGACDWVSKAVDDRTGSTAWTNIKPTVFSPGPAAWPSAENQNGALAEGVQYCVRVLARSDRDDKSADVISAFTTLAPAFTYTLPVDFGVDGDGPPLAMPGGSYLAPQPAPVNAATPLFRWTRVPGARAYWVVIARDSAFTQVIDLALTRSAAYAPRLRNESARKVPLTDETTSYFWAVLPAANADGTGVSETAEAGKGIAFNKRSFPPAAIAPAQDSVIVTQPTLRWTPAQGARRYRLQVSQDPTFAPEGLIDNVDTASTAYTSSTTYPADARIYWRVQALDENLVGQSWSCATPVDGRCAASAAPSSFQRTLPMPTPFAGNPTGGETIPVLAWNPVPGAVSYDLRAEHTDGKATDFTLFSTSFTPVLFYGNGIWRWKVRANFPTRSGKVSGGYFAAQEYVRGMGRTPNVRGGRTGSRVLLTWDPDPVAASYKIEISRSTGFGTAVDRTTTKTTSYAPDLSRRPYNDGGTLYWRVASVDGGRNTGAWTTGRFVFPKALRISASGSLRKGRSGALRVLVRDARRRPVRDATVRVTGNGLTSARRRTGSDGQVTLKLRPRKASTLTITVTRRGYADTTTTVQVR